MKKWNQFAKWLNMKKIAVLTGIIYMITMLPIWYLSFFARPSGDDYGYSWATHRTWLETHSLIEVFKTSLATTKSMCNTWNGDWFTVFIFTLMPEAFVTWSFWIVPVVMSILMILTNCWLAKEILVRRLGFKNYQSVMIASMVLLVSFQFVPSTAIALYWYVGTIHYILPHVVALAALVFLSKFERTGRNRYIVYSVLAAIMMGGSSYFSALLVFMIYVMVMFLFGRKKKKLFLLGIPLITGMAALIAQAVMPGNAARAAKEGSHLGFSAGMMLQTIFQSLWQAIESIGEYLTDKTLIFLVFAAIAVLAWECLQGAELSFRFPCPFLFCFFMYGFYAAMFAPEIYAAVEVSLGPPTMQYLTFILTVTASVIYVEGWLIAKRGKKDAEAIGKYHASVAVPFLLVCGIIVAVGKGMMGNSVFKESVDYIVSGQAADFKEQIDSQMEILLDDSIKEAYLCPINDQQGPLMHMPVTDDPEAFTNRVVANFYGKDMVVMEDPLQKEN